jgi:hypothetical protein
MSDLIATYEHAGVVHHIELVKTPDGSLLLDRGLDGLARVVAEVDIQHAIEEALAVLHAGGYLLRAQRGEPGLAPRLTDWLAGRQVGLPRAA